MVVERLPDAVVAVHRDRVLDAAAGELGADVLELPFERELGRVDADDGEPPVAVLLLPRSNVRNRPEPVDAGVGAEVEGDDAAAEPLGCEGLEFSQEVAPVSEGTEP